MTAAAREFVAPLTFQALSSNPVHCALLDEQAEAGMGHIELARWADLVLVAPATANVLARLACGFADDLLTTVCLATTAPLVLAPAMNRQMWQASATRANVRLLLDRGVAMLGPGEGDQACGDVGPGPDAGARGDRSPDRGPVRRRRARGRRGPRHRRPDPQRALDPVRFLTNHSTGKMGYAVAAAAEEEGARVSLVSGPTMLPAPPGIDRIEVTSAEEMYAEVMARAARCDIFIAAAAGGGLPARALRGAEDQEGGRPCRTRSRAHSGHRRRCGGDGRPPVSRWDSRRRRESLEAHAKDKLQRKGLDMIAANRVGLPDRGFASERNALTVLWGDGGSRELGLAPKAELARSLIGLVAERYRAEYPA